MSSPTRLSQLGVLGLLLLGGAVGAEAAVRYIAFGDSITRATGWPIAPEIVFDDDFPVPCMNNADECGYPRRLDPALTGISTSTPDTRNRGVGGEKTDEGLARIGTLLDQSNNCGPSTPGNCGALILMEGTNNASRINQGDPNYSVASTKADLGAMIDQATQRGIDTLLSTIVQRKAQDQITEDIADAIRDLATEKGRPLADPYDPLCENGLPDPPTCFQNNYYDPNQPDPFDVNHIDSDGYDIMSPVFEDVITAQGDPGQPSLTGPTGEIDDTTPTFTWSEDGNSTWYNLEVDGSVVDEWYEEDVVCSGSVCTATPSTVLSTGSHSFTVDGRNLRGPISNASSLSFDITAPTAVPTPTSPTGSICGASPTYTWDEIANTTSYDIQVDDIAGPLFTETFSDSVCGGGTCSTTASTPLTDGDHDWQVRGKNAIGDGTYSAELAFTVSTGVAGPATMRHPVIDIFATMPPYEWNHLPGTSDYDLEVDTTLIVENHLASAICSGAICSVTPATALGLGSHSWRVRANNVCGTGAWSGAQAFDVVACDPTAKDLPGQTVSMAVEEESCVQIDAGQLGPYTIQGPSGDVTFHVGSGGVIVLHDGFTVEDGAAFSAVVEP